MIVRAIDNPSPVPRSPRAGTHLAGSALVGFLLLLALSSPSAAGASGALQQPMSRGSADQGVRQIVVKFRPGGASRARAAAVGGGATDHTALGSRTEVMRLARGASLDATLRRLRTRSDVVWAVPDVQAHAAVVPFPNSTNVSLFTFLPMGLASDAAQRAQAPASG